MDLAVLGVNNSVAKSNKMLLVAARLSAGDNLDDTESYKRRKAEERSKELREKKFYGQFFEQN